MNQRTFLRPFVALAAALLVATSASAIDLNGSGIVTSAAFHPEVGDEALVLVSNTGRRPARVEIQQLRADDFSVISTSGPLAVPARTTASNTFIPTDFPVLVVVRYQAQGRTSVRVSLQVRDASGGTRIFTDGFESGDTSS